MNENENKPNIERFHVSISFPLPLSPPFGFLKKKGSSAGKSVLFALMYFLHLAFNCI